VRKIKNRFGDTGEEFRSFFSKIIYLGFEKNFLGTLFWWKTLDEKKSIRKKKLEVYS